ncbi:DUF748 domain-containing protein [Aerosticca soli]|jgi:hypothetical protein|nr:DUF748 domain-containing protein [Aerosticca soli]
MKTRWRRTWMVAGGILVVLLVARLALPSVLQTYLNRKMDRMGDYHGHVEEIDVHLWRGAYTIHDLRIEKVTGKVPVPFFSVATADIALSWRALSRGRLRGEVEFDQASLNFVDGRDESDTQYGRGVDWRDKLQLLLPMRIDELRVHRSQVTFKNFISRPRVDARLTDVEGTAQNLTNADRREGRRVAHLNAQAKVLGDAPLKLTASFDPLERQPQDFDFNLEIRDIRLPKLNDIARAYAGLDFEGGEGDFVMQLEAHDGVLDGYAKPLLHGVKVFSWKEVSEGENPLRAAWEAVAQTVTALFKNQQKDQFATRIPIHGRIDDKHLGVGAAIYGVLRNAFIQAYSPQLEDLKPAPKRD